MHAWLSSTPDPYVLSLSFFFHDPAPTAIYTLSLHDALCRSRAAPGPEGAVRAAPPAGSGHRLPLRRPGPDRKSTRLNSSHTVISYAVFCLKKKKSHAAVVPRSATMTRTTIHGNGAANRRWAT